MTQARDDAGVDGAGVAAARPPRFVATKGPGPFSKWIRPFAAESIANARERFPEFDILGPFKSKNEAHLALANWREQTKRHERQERCNDAREMGSCVAHVADCARAVREVLSTKRLTSAVRDALDALDAATARAQQASEGAAARAQAYADSMTSDASTETAPNDGATGGEGALSTDD